MAQRVVAESSSPPKIGAKRVDDDAHIWNNHSFFARRQQTLFYKSSSSSSSTSSIATAKQQQGQRLVRRSPARSSCNPNTDDDDDHQIIDSENTIRNQFSLPLLQQQQQIRRYPLWRNPQRFALYSYGMILMIIYVATVSRPLFNSRLHHNASLHSLNIPFYNNHDRQDNNARLSLVFPNHDSTATNNFAADDLSKFQKIQDLITLETVRIPLWKELYSYNSKGQNRRTRAKNHHHPRVWLTEVHRYLKMGRPPNYHSNHSTLSAYNDHNETTTMMRRMTTFRADCKPRSQWHTYTFPTCNTFHEMDWKVGLTTSANNNNYNNTHLPQDKDSGMMIQYLEKGGSRDTWIVQWNSLFSKPKIVLKTLRWRKQYEPVVYGHQRMDALALERLTSSPHVVNIFGYCAMSTLNEYAEIGNFGKEFLAKYPKNTTWMERLIVARDAALALAAVHDIDGPENPVSMVHHDFSPKNLVVVNGKLKLSDFNDAKLRRWNFDTDQACSGFNWDGLCGTSTERTHRRSPEECMGDDALRRGTDEKPEIYHLGCVLFVLLAGEEFPYYTEFSHSTGIRHKLTPSVARKHIITGKLPMLPPSVVEEERNGNVAVKAILHTMKWAFAFSPQDRPSAREVASFLSKAVTNLE